jgi:hypothetical protein
MSASGRALRSRRENSCTLKIATFNVDGINGRLPRKKPSDHTPVWIELARAEFQQLPFLA